MKEKIIKDLDVNFKVGDESIIEDYIKHYSSIASDNSNRKIDDPKLEPYVYKAVISAYIRRGAEGCTSYNDGVLSGNFIDIEEKLRKDCRTVRVVR